MVKNVSESTSEWLTEYTQNNSLTWIWDVIKHVKESTSDSYLWITESNSKIPSFSYVLKLAWIENWNIYNHSIWDLLKINKLAEKNRAIYEIPEVQKALRQVIATENHPALWVLLDVNIWESNKVVQTIWANMKPTNEAIWMVLVDEWMDVWKNVLRDMWIEPSYVDYKNFTKSWWDIPFTVEELNTIFREAFEKVLQSDSDLLEKYQKILAKWKTISFAKIVSDIKANSQFDHFLQMAKSRLKGEKALENVTDWLHWSYREKFESFMKRWFSKESFTSQPVIIKWREWENATYMTKKYSISEDWILSIEKTVTWEKAELERYQIFITDKESWRKVLNDSILHMVKKGDIPAEFPFAWELKYIMRTWLANSECILPFWNKVDQNWNFVDEKILETLRKLWKNTDPKLIEELLSIDYKWWRPKKYMTSLVTEAIEKWEDKIAWFFDVAKMWASNVSWMFEGLPVYYNKIDDIMKKMPEWPERIKAIDIAYDEYLSTFWEDMTKKMQLCVQFLNKWKAKSIEFNVWWDEVWIIADKEVFAAFEEDFLGFVKDAWITWRFSYAELRDINKTWDVATWEKALDGIEKCSWFAKALEKKLEWIANSLKNKYSWDTYTTLVEHLNKLWDMRIFIKDWVRMVKFPHAPFGEGKIVFAIDEIIDIDIETKYLLPNSILTKYLDETWLWRATEVSNNQIAQAS